MAIRDLLASETADNTDAARAAADGRSLTGLSGRHTPMGDSPIFGTTATGIPGMTEAVQQATPISDIPVRRSPVDRVPFGDDVQRMAYPARPGYRNYWFNDEPGRVFQAKRAGYEHVKDQETGEPVSMVVDKTNNRGMRAYLMETPVEFYNEDMARKASVLERRLNDIRHGQDNADQAENRYVPSQGISVKRGGRPV